MAINSLPASTSLRKEFEELAPYKATAQNGTIGDTAHQKKGKSDHLPDETTPALKGKDADGIDEVHARDEDSRGQWPKGWSMQRCIDIILDRCRRGLEKRLRYIIFDGSIYEASNGWRKVKYTGDDQHTTHAHFSFVYGSGAGTSNPENITSPWGFLAAYQKESTEVLSNEDKVWLADQIDKAATKAAERVWATKITDYVDKDKPQRQLTAAVWTGYSDGREDETQRVVVAAVQTGTKAILDAIAALPAGGDVDEDKLAADLLSAVAEALSTRPALPQ